MKYYDVDINQEEIYERLKRPVSGASGQMCILNTDVIGEALRLGFDAIQLNFNFTRAAHMVEQLREHVEKNKSPIIATQRSSATSQFGHSRVVIGLIDPTEEDDRQLICVHDPSNHFQNGCPPGGPGRKWKSQDFANIWKPNAQTPGGVGILIKPRIS